MQAKLDSQFQLVVVIRGDVDGLNISDFTTLIMSAVDSPCRIVRRHLQAVFRIDSSSFARSFGSSEVQTFVANRSASAIPSSNAQRRSQAALSRGACDV